MLHVSPSMHIQDVQHIQDVSLKPDRAGPDPAQATAVEHVTQGLFQRVVCEDDEEARGDRQRLILIEAKVEKVHDERTLLSNGAG